MRLGVMANGAISDYVWLKSICVQLDGLICADGGANHAYVAGFTPKMIVGDLDSVKPEVLKYYMELGVPVHRFAVEKDETDLQLALGEAIELGAKQIVLLGAVGNRIDHVLGNISLLVFLHTHGVKGVILDEHNELSLAEAEVTINGTPGEEVSLLPLTAAVTGIWTENLKYPMQGGEFKLGNPRGISNVLMAESARVTMEQGLLLVIKSRD